MAIILRKKINEIHPEAAVLLKKDLPTDDKVQIVRYVKIEKKFYMFTGYTWIEIDLVIE